MTSCTVNWWKTILVLVAFYLVNSNLNGQETYATKLGYKATDKIIILHVDDVGMSYEAVAGPIDAIEHGIAKSWSIMMPCPWVPAVFHYLKDHPLTDAGLHLTLTSEWKDYRWEPLAGAKVVPGLVDSEGAFHKDVRSVVQYASAEEVDLEIKAQLDRCRKMGWEPTHMDSHMGTLFAKPEFLAKYIQLGIDQKVPIMLPAGHNHLVKKSEHLDETTLQFLKQQGKRVWDSGLPVIDDLHNLSYGWKPSPGLSKKKLKSYKTQYYIESFKDVQPGITYVIMHCSSDSEILPHITDSGPIRLGDLDAMKDPALKNYLQKEGIQVTTMRELMERRKNSHQ